MAIIYATLDPVQLLSAIRSGQQRLVEIADRPVSGERLALTAATLEEFLSGLRTAWREGEVRPTSRSKEKASVGGVVRILLGRTAADIAASAQGLASRQSA